MAVAICSVPLRTFPGASGATPNAARGTQALPIPPANWKNSIPIIGMSAIKSVNNSQSSATPDCYCTLAEVAGRLVPNSCFTDSRTSTRMVNTPSTVPKGMNRHSMPAITRQNW